MMMRMGSYSSVLLAALLLAVPFQVACDAGGVLMLSDDMVLRSSPSTGSVCVATEQRGRWNSAPGSDAGIVSYSSCVSPPLEAGMRLIGSISAASVGATSSSFVAGVLSGDATRSVGGPPSRSLHLFSLTRASQGDRAILGYTKTLPLAGVHAVDAVLFTSAGSQVHAAVLDRLTSAILVFKTSNGALLSTIPVPADAASLSAVACSGSCASAPVIILVRCARVFAVVDVAQQSATVVQPIFAIQLPIGSGSADCASILNLNTVAASAATDGKSMDVAIGWTSDWNAAVNTTSPAYAACDAAHAAASLCSGLQLPLAGTSGGAKMNVTCSSIVSSSAASSSTLASERAFAGFASSSAFSFVRTRRALLGASVPEGSWLPAARLSALLATVKTLDAVHQPSISRTAVSAATQSTSGRLVISADGVEVVVGPPVNGGWSSFTPFSPCNNSCGVGLSCRNRSCSLPFPEQGGAPCDGASVECVSCTVLPVHWEVGSWGSCQYSDGRPVTCDVGIQKRTLTCRQCTGLEVLPSVCRDIPPPPAQQACDVFGPWAWKPFSSTTCVQKSCTVGTYPTVFKCWSICNNTQVSDSVCSVFPAPPQPSCAVTETVLYRPYAWVVSYGGCVQDGCYAGHIDTTVGDCHNCQANKVLDTTLCGPRPTAPSCNSDDTAKAPFTWSVGGWYQTNSDCCKTFSRNVNCVDCGGATKDDSYCSDSKPKTSCETTDGGCRADPACWFGHSTNC